MRHQPVRVPKGLGSVITPRKGCLTKLGRGVLVALVGLLGAACANTKSASLPAAPARSARAVPQQVLCSAYRVNRHGPQCVRELSDAEARQRAYYWKLTIEHGLVIHSTHLNGRRAIQYDDDGDGEYKYSYQNGELTEIQALGRLQVLRLRTVFSNQGKRTDRKDEWGRPSFSDETARVSELRELDENGFVRETRYLALDGAPVKSSGGYYTSRALRDARGLEQRECYFDSSGKPMSDRWGAHCIEYVNDGFGNAIDSRLLDTAMRPTQNVFGVHRAHREIDGVGNVRSVAWFGLDGKPVVVTNHSGSCASQVFHVIDGLAVGGECLDEHGHLAPYRSGHAVWRDRFDDHGNSVEGQWFGPDGRPVAAPNAARVTLVHDANGLISEQNFYLPDGTKGQRHGPATIRYRRGSYGLTVSEQYFDANGQPTTQRGCARFDFEWNRFRQRTRSTCFDKKGVPAADNQGVSVLTFEYDSLGRLERESYRGVDGHAINLREGYASVVVRYDSHGVESGKEFFDAANRRVMLPRFRLIRVRPPFVSPDYATGERSEAFAQIESAQRRIAAGEDFERVALEISDLEVSAQNPGDRGYFQPSAMIAAVRLATEGLKVGEVSPVVEIPGGLFVYQRTE